MSVLINWRGGQDQDTASLRKFMETEETKETTGKLNVKLNHHLLCHLIQSCSQRPEHEYIFKENPHLYYIKEEN